MKQQNVEVLIIGGGQAGLAMGYYLKKHGLSFVILDGQKRIGDAWRKRYESLVLFTPRRYSSLPGLALQGDPDGLPNKNEVANYLECYANEFGLPVHTNVEVLSLEKIGETFIALTSTGTIVSKRVVVATGPFHTPFIPEIEGELSKNIFQIHSAHYRQPADMPEGPLLVVGGGNTGIQISLELSETRHVYLAVGEERMNLPIRFIGKNIFWWFDKLGFLEANGKTKLGEWLSQKKDPVFGMKEQLTNQIRKEKITILQKVTALHGQEIALSNHDSITVNSVLWATGFKQDFSWIHIPVVFNKKGMPIHQRGVTSIPDLYFLGLPWQYRRGSALIGGVGRDAEYILEHMKQV